VFVFDFG
jgi:hypothetical protein